MHWGRACGALALLLVAFIGLTLVLTSLENGLLAVAGAGVLGWWVGAARGLWHQVAASLAAITLIYAWMVGRRRWTPASVGFDVRWLRAMATGVVWGAGLAGVVLVLTVLGGARVVSGPALAGERYVGGALMVLVGLGAAAMVVRHALEPLCGRQSAQVWC